MPTQQNPHPITGEYMLSIRGVMAKCDLGKTTILRMVKDGTFPQPLSITPTLKRWRGADVDGWIREQFTSLK